MKYADFCRIVSRERMNRYLLACGGDKRRAQQLYRYNNAVGGALFAVIAYFEVALRNGIDQRMRLSYGGDWLRDAALPGGMFASNPRCADTTALIANAYRGLQRKGSYAHCALLSELDFGNWRYMFSPSQYRATGQILLSMFPKKPKSTAAMQYNSTFVFNKLAVINRVRNRIAHHEPVCFVGGVATSATVREAYGEMLQLLRWMDIDTSAFLRHVDKVELMCNKIDDLMAKVQNSSR